VHWCRAVYHAGAESDAAALSRLEDRIKPAGQVITDAAALLKVSAKTELHR